MGKSDSELSVVIACYYTHEWVVRAVSSAINQTLRPLEILLISDDQTDYIRTLSESNIPLDIVRQLDTGKIGAGCFETRNIGRASARGKYVTRLDSDDSWHPKYLEHVMPVVQECGACLSPVKTLDLQGTNDIHANGYRKLPQYSERVKLAVEEYIWLEFGWNTIFDCSLINKQWEPGLNTDLLVETCVFEKIGFVPFHPFQGYQYHIRPGSICHNPDAPKNIIEEYECWLSRVEGGDDFGFSAHILSEFRMMLLQRINSVKRYLHDLEHDTLKYQPKVVLDIMLYPEAS